LLVNSAVLLFALIPTVPLLAGQINYDSLMLLALAWVCWLVLKITEDLNGRRLEFKTCALLVASLLLACLVKYAFLPLALAAVLYVVVLIVVSFRGHGNQLQDQLKKSYTALSPKLRLTLLVTLVVCSGLIAQRYGLNLIKYGDPLPACDAVIGTEACMDYGPWARDYIYSSNNLNSEANPLTYTWTWLQGLHYRLFFMIDGPPENTNYPPSPLPAATAVIVLIFGSVATLFYWRRAFARRPFLVFVILITVSYLTILWWQNFAMFVRTGQPVAINGRYLIPMILPMALVLGASLGIALKRWPKLKVYAAVVAIALFTQGGGVFGFILRSDHSWYWPNHTVNEVNQSAQKLLDPIIFEGPKSY
jgi:hypothetical protein